jgi:GTP pyrophosphokinase
MSKQDDTDAQFDELLQTIVSYNPSADLARVRKAWEFADAAHTGQKRLSGGPYIAHPLSVAIILASWRLDTTSIIAGLLHDTVEDGGATRKDLVTEFGEDVARLVDGVTKVTELRLKGSKTEEFVENLRKMLLAMAKDLRVILVKLADRLHNMRTLNALTPDKQIENARETLEVYAPLAERLGMGTVKGELEDLSFAYVYPEEYRKVDRESVSIYKNAEKHIETMKKAILKKLTLEKIDAVVKGRKKHLYSLWTKLSRSEIDWDYDKVHDIVALRILVQTVPDCYRALGIVHSAYKPVPYIGVSDFIAQPKPNGYRSLHTKVFGPDGRIVEVQIRTFKMHDEAENGVAAHWTYSEEKGRGATNASAERGFFAPVEKLSWVKQLVKWQNEITDSEEFLKTVKFDAFKHRNFVFTPMGDVYDLPTGATPIDFAYAVHTDLVNYLTGAKVDGRIVPLDYKLKSGQVVEILKSKNPKKPSQKWIEFAVTALARSEIKKQLRSEAEKG